MTETVADRADSGTATTCFHCGLPLPAGLDLRVSIDGLDQPMCCHGCQAV
ncbi:MAG: heavy metal translocating P-type ATPase metal-binding domain-containing protein, partial [Gammaproteobacteria bacterium]|nr:heavy metal translocating P-type ATPase metal-binding domain-containing protein [Gammaproteobacteria bacterium]